jgi:seryl-tRNA synthetase
MSKRRPKPNVAEYQMVRALDKLAEFDEFCDDILPLLREAVKGNVSAEELQNHPKIKAALVARQLSIGLKEKDAGKALAAIKDIRDRIDGKAVERKDIKMSLENAKDEELEARLKTLMAETDLDEDSVH